ncbi:hypothetical protein MTO96_010832 [Rhipicephalus appendiculatus]
MIAITPRSLSTLKAFHLRHIARAWRGGKHCFEPVRLVTSVRDETASDDVLSIYYRLLGQGELLPDENQLKIAQLLKELQNKIAGYTPHTPGMFEKWFYKAKKASRQATGIVYIWCSGSRQDNVDGHVLRVHNRWRASNECTSIHSCWTFTTASTAGSKSRPSLA